MAAALLGVLIKVRKVEVPRVPEFIKLTSLMGLLAFSIPFALVYWGQQHIETGLASILFATFPLWVAMFSNISLPNEPVGVVKWIGSLSGFVGIYFIFESDFALQGEMVIAGMGAIVLSAFIQAFITVKIKKHGQLFPAMSLSFVAMLIGGLTMLMFSVLVEDYSTVRFDDKAIFSTIYLAFFGSVVTFVTYFWLLKRVEAVLLSLTAFITPIVAVITGALVLAERLPGQIFLGSAFVLGGILLANLREVLAVLRKGKAFIIDQGQSLR